MILIECDFVGGFLLLSFVCDFARLFLELLMSVQQNQRLAQIHKYILDGTTADSNTAIQCTTVIQLTESAYLFTDYSAIIYALCLKYAHKFTVCDLVFLA